MLMNSKVYFLMQYLIRVAVPKGAVILDPSMGSGSAGKAVMYENIDRVADCRFIGIEITEEYLPIAAARISYAARSFNQSAQGTRRHTELP